jgi:predicted dehydrogenase
MTSFEQWPRLPRAGRDRRIYSGAIRSTSRPARRYGELVQAGAIGQVIGTVGLGPHAIRNNQWPEWFSISAMAASSGIGTPMRVPLFFAGTRRRMVSASVANCANPNPGLQDLGDMHLRAPSTTGVRVDRSPRRAADLGRRTITILGTEGYTELRKYIDIAGRPGTDHLFLVDGKGTAPRLLAGRAALRQAADRRRPQPHGTR